MFEPRYYQRDACTAVNAGLAQGDNGLLVVLPTGSGKTIVLADLIHDWLTQWPETRVCVLAHTKELVEQNAVKFRDYWRQRQNSDAPMGIYCAGLKRKDAHASVLFASIQSVSKKAMELGAFDIIMVDEAHHIPTEKDEGIWKRFLLDASRANSNVRIVGLSATPYRLGSGPIVGKDTILKRICYEISVLDLIKDGFLCPLVTKSSTVQADTSTLHIRKGEYVAAEIETLMDQESLISGAVQDMLTHGADRKSWIVFCAGVAHAQHVQDALSKAGVPAGLVTGETPATERDRIIADFKAGRMRALCNVNVLCEGFDSPDIDLVALLRPTKSAGLYYQQCGRAFRLSPRKQDALILDFAGVIAEHGPIDCITAKKPKTKADDEESQIPTKKCPECQTVLHLSAAQCPHCGYLFPNKPKHGDHAELDIAILSNQIKPVRHAISTVHYSKHVGKSAIPTLRVDYFSGFLRIASEWVCFEHAGYALQKARKWLKARALVELDAMPDSVAQAMNWLNEGLPLKTPSAIHVIPAQGSRKYPEIVHFEWPA